MINNFSKYWNKTRIKYGVERFDKDLILQLTDTIKCGKVLEVGIGDGYPYANSLDEAGYEVYGIDLAPVHIDMVKESLPDVVASVGDAENLEFNDDMFDIVFCFRSTWYFPRLDLAVSEMLRVTKQKGLIMFDIQNGNHPIHVKARKEQLRREKYYSYELLMRFVKNLAKLVVRPIKFFPTHWSLDKHVTIESPSNPDLIDKQLAGETGLSYKIFGVKWEDPLCSLIEISSREEFGKFDRLVWKIYKA